MSEDSFKDSALRYHSEPTPGKLAIRPTKPLANNRDLSRAYSPGVAFACEAIADNPTEAAKLTARGNLVAPMVRPCWDWVTSVRWRPSR